MTGPWCCMISPMTRRRQTLVHLSSRTRLWPETPLNTRTRSVLWASRSFSHHLETNCYRHPVSLRRPRSFTSGLPRSESTTLPLPNFYRNNSFTTLRNSTADSLSSSSSSTPLSTTKSDGPNARPTLEATSFGVHPDDQGLLDRVFNVPGMSALWKLTRYYQLKLGLVNLHPYLHSSSITVQEKVEGTGTTTPRLVWTASLTCPATGRIYLPGTMTDPAPWKIPDASSPNSDSESTPDAATERPLYYAKKPQAVQAVASRALDHLQYLLWGHLEPRLCPEDPSTLPPTDQDHLLLSGAPSTNPDTTSMTSDPHDGSRDPVGDEPDAAEWASSRPHTLGMEGQAVDAIFHHQTENKYEHEERRQGRENQTAAAHFMMSSSSISIEPEITTTVLEGKPLEVSSEDDYVLVYLEDDSSSSHSYTSPSQRILEALSRPQLCPPVQNMTNRMMDGSGPSPNHAVLLLVDPIRRLRRAIASAEIWINEHDPDAPPIGDCPDDPYFRSVHHLILPRTESPNLLLMAKVLLFQLADSWQAIPHSPRHETYGVQKTAQRILDILWSKEQSPPDAEAYTYFLKCLEGDGPISVAKRAEKVVRSMESGRPWGGRVPPPPNMSTWNALIQIWAQVGGTTGRYEKIDSPFFKPNRESFLAILSSNVYRPVIGSEQGGFDLAFARGCIDGLAGLAEQDPSDISLIPDTQVYNAPLRWAGGSHWRISRPYARSVSWDDYRIMFAGGFKSLDTKSAAYVEADAMDEWLRDMEQLPNLEARPNIETYEALLQAWVRTCTREGLERAEEIAQALLSTEESDAKSHVYPRLQTFHPIIAAWLHAKTAESASRVDLWIERLRSASQNIPELRPDGRMVLVQLFSHLSRQTLLLGKLETTPSDTSLHDIVALAEACTRVIESSCETVEKTIESSEAVDIVTSKLFVLSIQAWENVLIATRNHGDDRNIDMSVERILRIIGLFDHLIEKLVKTKLNSSSRYQLDFEVGTFLEQGREVYSAFVGILRIIDAHSKSEAKVTNAQKRELNMSKFIFVMERMVRRIGEFEQLLSPRPATSVVSDGKGTNDALGANVREPEYSIGTNPDQFDYMWIDWKNIRSSAHFLKKVVNFLGETVHEGKKMNGDLARLLGIMKQVGEETGNLKIVERVKLLLDRKIRRAYTAVKHNVSRLPRTDSKQHNDRDVSKGAETVQPRRMVQRRPTSSKRRPHQRPGRVLVSRKSDLLQ